MNIEIDYWTDPISMRNTRFKVISGGDTVLTLLDNTMFPYEVDNGVITIANSRLSDFLELAVWHTVTSSNTKLMKRIEATKVPKVPPRVDKPMPTFKVKPFKMQEEARDIALRNRLVLLGDKMGSGKTFTSLMIAESLKSKFDFKHTLIICGIKDTQFQWEDQINKFSYENGRIIGKRVTRNGTTVLGSNPEKLEELTSDIEEFYLIINVHALRDREILDRVVEMVYNGDIGFVAVDEAHKCVGITAPKNLGKDKKTKVPALNEIRPFYRLPITGTPFNSPIDMYEIEKWLGQTFSTKDAYYKRYGEFVIDYTVPRKGRMMPTKYMFIEFDLFKKDISRFIIRRDNSEGLPSVIPSKHYVELTPKQRKFYDSTPEAKTLADLRSLDIFKEEIQSPKYMDLRRAITLPRELGIDTDSKMEAVKRLLEEILANDEQAIIFTYFREGVNYYQDELEKVFPNKGTYVTESSDVYECVQKIQNGEASFIVGNYLKIGTGFDLQRADYIIFVDLPYTWSEYSQSFHRARRVGRSEPVRIINLLAIDTHEEKMWGNLMYQKKVEQIVFDEDDTYWEVI